MCRSRHHVQTTHKIRAGFTLVEILIVVIILGILAAIVIPNFTNATQLTRENTLHDELRFLRSQIQIYAAQHTDTAPGYPVGGPGQGAPTFTDFVNQMTEYTQNDGGSSSTESNTYEYGPYLSQMPANPVNGLSTFTVVADGASFPTTADGTTGFIYQPQTMQLEPNIPGNDSAGEPFISY